MSAPFRPDSTILFNIFRGFVKLNIEFENVNFEKIFNLKFHLKFDSHHALSQ
jgi:hypothetical protein